MAIRTKEELIDRIAADHVWRKREISELKDIITVHTASTIRKSVLCRSGMALIYAHWEGFVKVSGSYFLEYIANQRHQIRELKSNFITLILRGRINQAKESKKFSAFDEITQFLLGNLNTRARLQHKKILDTRSNLSTNVLKEIAWCLGLDYSIFASKEKLIDHLLVDRRNNIAHGQELDINEEDFTVMADEVLGLMNTFRNLIENSAVTNQYKAA